MAKPANSVIEFNKIKPKTVNQSKLVKAIYENDIIFCEGISGTGKSLLSLGIACELLLAQKFEKILISRTVVPCGEIGFLPGNVGEKAEPYFAQHLIYLEKILGKNYRKYISDGKIILKPLEVLRGSNFENTIMINDESQNSDAGQLKMWITRLGQNAKCICLGDLSQKDIDSSGFKFCLNSLGSIKGVSIVNFDESDILRNGIIGDVIRIFNKYGY